MISSFRQKIKQQKYKKLLTFGAVFLILVLAFSLRTYQIDTVPGGIYPDEAVNGMDAYKTYTGTQEFAWFYPDNNGREGLYINLIALTYSVFGVTIFGLKFWSIVFGVLTVLGTYLFTREIFQSKKAGLIAALFVAVSFWSINFSRIAFRAIMLAPVILFSFWLLFRGVRLKTYAPFILGGLIFGLGMHTYIAFRIVPLILIFLFIAVMLSRESFIKTYWKHTLLFIVFACISAAPMLYTFYTHPEYLESRSADVSIFSEELNHGDVIGTFLHSFTLSMLKYNFIGDHNWRHNYPPYPVLNPVVGVLFVLGFMMSVVRFFRLLFVRIQTKMRNRKLEVYTVLLTWFFSLHVPEFLTAEGIPHALRSIGALPVIYIFATLPLLWFLEERIFLTKWNLKLRYSIVIILFLFVGIFNGLKYHVYWAAEPEQHLAFNANLLKIAEHMQSLPKDTQKYIVAGPMERIPIQLMTTESQNTTYIYPDQISQIHISPAESFVVFYLYPDEVLIDQISQEISAFSIQELYPHMPEKYYTLESRKQE